MIRQSYTAVIAQNESWSGEFETEPYETAWAGEAIFFVRALEAANAQGNVQARVQVSPDGIHWCDEGTLVSLPTERAALTFSRVSHFGGWLRLQGELPSEARLKVMVYLVLKA